MSTPDLEQAARVARELGVSGGPNGGVGVELATKRPESQPSRIRNAIGDLMWRVLRPTLADVWDEGYAAGVDDERLSEWNIGIAGMGMKVSPARRNPYRGDDQ